MLHINTYNVQIYLGPWNKSLQNKTLWWPSSDAIYIALHAPFYDYAINFAPIFPHLRHSYSNNTRKKLKIRFCFYIACLLWIELDGFIDIRIEIAFVCLYVIYCWLRLHTFKFYCLIAFLPYSLPNGTCNITHSRLHIRLHNYITT